MLRSLVGSEMCIRDRPPAVSIKQCLSSNVYQAVSISNVYPAAHRYSTWLPHGRHTDQNGARSKYSRSDSKSPWMECIMNDTVGLVEAGRAVERTLRSCSVLRCDCGHSLWYVGYFIKGGESSRHLPACLLKIYYFEAVELPDQPTHSRTF